jgi:hypothetical protein
VNICLQRSIRKGEGRRYRLNTWLTLTAVVLVMVTLGASLAMATTNQIPFIYSPLSPGHVTPGSKTFTLTVYGTAFVSGATVYWNGSALTTTFVSSTKLTASVPAANVATAGTAVVTVENPGTIASNRAYFQIQKNSYTTAYGSINYPTDTTPNDVATASFRNDGYYDLAVATGDNTVSILLGNGTGTFPASVQYSVPGNPVAIIVGDFNGDGIPDIATADQYTSQVSILLGNGDGTFQTHQEYATGPAPVALAAGDFNGDGILDLAVVDSTSGQVSILLGNGNGSFQTAVNYTVGTSPAGIAIGDYNADGKLDLAVANNGSNTVSILLGNGNGTFQTQVTYATGENPTGIATANFTSSDTQDLAVVTSNKYVDVLLGNGNGTFQNFVAYGIGADAFVIAIGDVNSDGYEDIVTGNYNDNTVSVLIGNGNGTFKSEAVFPSIATPVGLAIADYNNDGRLDVAVAGASVNAAGVLLDGSLVLSPGDVGFGTVTSGDKSAAKTATLTNQGTTAYTMGTISQVGTDYTDFTYTDTTCPAQGGTLAAGKSCTFSNYFDPVACESANGQLLITNGSSIVGFQETGTGNIPIMLSPRTVEFKTYQLVGTTSPQQDTTFTNTSGVDVVFSTPYIVLNGVNETEFAMVPPTTGTNCLTLSNYTLAPGASCSTGITFSPTESGGANVTQIFYGNFCTSPQGDLVEGNGTAVKVTPTSLTFPSVAVGSTSTGVVTFQNAGSTAMPITSAVPSGTAAVFFIQSNTCGFTQGSGGSVPANSSCTFTLEFTPLAAEKYTGSFTIGDPDPTGPQVVTLTGTGTAASVKRK